MRTHIPHWLPTHQRSLQTAPGCSADPRAAWHLLTLSSSAHLLCPAVQEKGGWLHGTLQLCRCNIPWLSWPALPPAPPPAPQCEPEERHAKTEKSAFTEISNRSRISKTELWFHISLTENKWDVSSAHCLLFQGDTCVW